MNRGLQGLRLPIAPMGVERRPGGGLVPEVPGDPGQLIKMVLDLQQEKQRRDDELAHNFPGAAEKSQEFAWSGNYEAADKTLEPYGMKAKRVAVPGHPEPIAIPGHGEMEGYFRNILVPGSGAPASVRKEARESLERIQKGREGERRFNSAQKAVQDRFDKAEAAKERRHLEKQNKQAKPPPYRDYLAYKDDVFQQREGLLKQWLEQPQGKSAKREAMPFAKNFRPGGVVYGVEPQGADEQGLADTEILDERFRKTVAKKRAEIEKQIQLLSPEEYQAKWGSSPAAAPASPAPKSQDPAGTVTLGDPDVLEIVEAARGGDKEAQAFLRERRISW